MTFFIVEITFITIIVIAVIIKILVCTFHEYEHLFNIMKPLINSIEFYFTNISPF